MYSKYSNKCINKKNVHKKKKKIVLMRFYFNWWNGCWAWLLDAWTWTCCSMICVINMNRDCLAVRLIEPNAKISSRANRWEHVKSNHSMITPFRIFPWRRHTERDQNHFDWTNYYNSFSNLWNSIEGPGANINIQHNISISSKIQYSIPEISWALNLLG